MAFQRQLAITAIGVNPEFALTDADRGNQRAPIGGDRDPILLRRPKCELLRFSVRESLAPEMTMAIDICSEIHPFPVRRPCRRGTFPIGPDLPAG